MEKNLSLQEKDREKIVKEIHEKIIKWGKKNLRRYPWRETTNPYRILVAEFMLHRTRADQVKDSYEIFIKKYPDLRSIANTGPENIKNEFRSLGLFWRADLLYELSKEILEKYNGEIPVNRKKLLELPGMGDYIASAILCFGFNLPEPILDTNTVRIIGRIFGLKVSDSSRRNKKFEKIMNRLVRQGEPRNFSLSMIDFGAKVCTSRKPNCDSCPLKGICLFRKDKEDVLIERENG